MASEITEKLAQRLIDTSSVMRGWSCVQKKGSGSFGTVFEISRRGNENCALKIIPIPLSDHELDEKRLEFGDDQSLMRNEFQRQVDKVREKEITVLETCKGETNIVQLYEWDVIPNPENPICFYVLIRMEMLIKLEDYLAGKRQKDVLRMFRDIAHALEFLESRKMLHRDIKRANIMVSKGGVFKLTDFGEARDILKNNAASTKAGAPFFMAPEVANGRRYDNRADIYSLAITVYNCLFNYRYPFQEREGYSAVTAWDAYNMRISGERRIPGIPDLDPDFNAILLKCLEYNPEMRYPSARMLSDDIDSLMNKRGFVDALLSLPSRLPEQNTNGGQTGVSKPHSHKALIIVLASVFGVALIGGIVALILMNIGFPPRIQIETDDPTAADAVTPTASATATVAPITEPPITEPPQSEEAEGIPEETGAAWPHIQNGIGYRLRLNGTDSEPESDGFGSYIVPENGNVIIEWDAVDGYTGSFDYIFGGTLMHSGNKQSAVSWSGLDKNTVTTVHIEKTDDNSAYAEIKLIRDDYDPASEQTIEDGSEAGSGEAVAEISIEIEGYQSVAPFGIMLEGVPSTVELYTINGDSATFRWSSTVADAEYHIEVINTQTGERKVDWRKERITELALPFEYYDLFGSICEFRVTMTEHGNEISQSVYFTANRSYVKGIQITVEGLEMEDGRYVFDDANFINLARVSLTASDDVETVDVVLRNSSGIETLLIVTDENGNKYETRGISIDKLKAFSLKSNLFTEGQSYYLIIRSADYEESVELYRKPQSSD